jgi:hypothetical protein
MMKGLLLIVVTGCLPALGQTPDGALSGQIREPGGNPVASVRVSLTPKDGNNLATVVTNNDGFFHIERVAPGQYTLLAGAFMATILPGTADASQAVVYTTRAPFDILTGDGTFFPGTINASQAAVITVTPGSTNTNIDFALAAGASPYSDASLRAVHGKIVVEGGGRPAIKSDQFSLFFSDGPDNRAALVTFMDGPRKLATSSTRLETSIQGFETVTGVVPMPAFPDGAFRIFVRDGVYRVIQPASPASLRADHSQQGGYYVKAMSFGGMDLMKDLMRVRGPVANELVITLAKCTAATQDPLCP